MNERNDVGNSAEGLVVTLLPGKVTLDACPPGLFWFDGDYGFKTEYRDHNGPEAYCVDSGEYFWGGLGGDAEKRRGLLVSPCRLIHNAEVGRIAGQGEEL